jgi:NADP-dependent 3-hydroxy acid dehydrogenase YdfG
VPERVTWVTGAGSGIGRAAAVRAAASGSRVAVSGRREGALLETVDLIEGAGGSALALPLDSRDPDAVTAAHDRILNSVGHVTDLVLAAGANAPRRYWRDQSMAEFTSVVDTNLTAVALHIDAVLPGMREASFGTIVVVSSFSAWRFSPDAGVAYSASKSALASICQTLNAQEEPHGVRACHLCPGDVATDFLDHRPVVPDAIARENMLTPDDVARAIQFVLDSPPRVRLDELVISPVKPSA